MIVSPTSVAKPVLRPALVLMAVLLVYSVVLTVLFSGFGYSWLGIEALPMSLLASAVGIVVGIRNTLAWARWWEARTLWGAVVNNSRSLARSALTLMPGSGTLVARLVHLQIAYVHALRLALLRKDPWGELGALLPVDVLDRVRNATNVPFALQREMGGVLAEARQEGVLSDVGLFELHRLLSELANAQGGSERIKNTPMPLQFDRFPSVLVGAFCVLLPIGLVPDIGWFAPVATAVIGFAFYLIDQVGRELSRPFENQVTDIPMAALTRTIEIDLRQALDEPHTLTPLAPVDGVLW